MSFIFFNLLKYSNYFIPAPFQYLNKPALKYL